MARDVHKKTARLRESNRWACGFRKALNSILSESAADVPSTNTLGKGLDPVGKTAPPALPAQICGVKGAAQIAEDALVRMRDVCLSFRPERPARAGIFSPEEREGPGMPSY